jgi:transcriptional regulator with XRE-family HTH domain
VSLQATFGANVRHYRKAEGLTQGELAERVDLSLDMIGKIERGATAPSFETIEKLADALNTQEAVFFGPHLMAIPTGERGRLLKRINIHLSRMNEDELAQAEKVLAALG